jgi:hypothetical protein
LTPSRNQRRVAVNPNGYGRRFFMQEHRPSTEMRLNISRVRREKVDDLMIRLSFAARISHRRQSSSKLAMMSSQMGVRNCGVLIPPHLPSLISRDKTESQALDMGEP